MNIDEQQLWESKVAQKRDLRQKAYEEFLKRGMLGYDPVLLSANLYEIARENLGDLNIMWREIVEGAWKWAPDDTDFQKLHDSHLEEIYGFVRSEETLVDDEILVALMSQNRLPDRAALDAGKGILRASSRVLLGRCTVMLSYLKESRLKEIAKGKKEESRWRLERILQGASIVIVFITAVVSLTTFFYTRKEFYLRNKPYLSFSLDKYPGKMSELAGKKEVELSILVTNHGETPARNMIRYAVAVVDGKALFGVNADAPVSADGNLSVKYIGLSENIVYPGKSQSFSVSIPVEQFVKLLGARDKDRSGINFKVDYNGPWGAGKKREYFSQSNILPWQDKNIIHYRANSEKLSD